MIEVNKNHVEIKGTNQEVLTDFILLFEDLLKITPEIVNATVAGFIKPLENSIPKCNPETLNLLVEIVQTYLERRDK